MSIKSEVQKITPQEALRILKEKNPHNRMVRLKWVVYLASLITSDKFFVTHQGIAFDVNGDLLDGQHRLWACVLANKPIKILVVTGLPVDTRPVVDDTARRTVSDKVRIETGSSLKSWVAGMARFMIIAPDSHWSDKIITQSQSIKFIELNRDAIDFVQDAFKGNLRGVTRAAVLAVIGRAYYHVDEKILRDFATVLLTGFQERSSHKLIIRLRNYLIKDVHSKIFGTDGQLRVYQKVQNVLRMFRDGKNPAHLESTKEDLFPLPEDRLIILGDAKQQMDKLRDIISLASA